MSAMTASPTRQRAHFFANSRPARTEANLYIKIRRTPDLPRRGQMLFEGVCLVHTSVIRKACARFGGFELQAVAPKTAAAGSAAAQSQIDFLLIGIAPEAPPG